MVAVGRDIASNMKKKARKGQAALEYVLSFAALLVVFGIVWKLVDVSIRYADRTETLVSDDYP